jgi:hypothetical protein
MKVLRAGINKARKEKAAAIKPGDEAKDLQREQEPESSSYEEYSDS